METVWSLAGYPSTHATLDDDAPEAGGEGAVHAKLASEPPPNLLWAVPPATPGVKHLCRITRAGDQYYLTSEGRGDTLQLQLNAHRKPTASYYDYDVYWDGELVGTVQSTGPLGTEFVMHSKCAYEACPRMLGCVLYEQVPDTITIHSPSSPVSVPPLSSSQSYDNCRAKWRTYAELCENMPL